MIGDPIAISMASGSIAAPLPLGVQEEKQGHQSAGEGGGRARRQGAAAGPGGEAPGQPGQPHRREQRTDPVRRRPFGIDAFRHRDPGEEDGGEADRQVKEADRRPAEPVDQPAAEQRRPGRHHRPRRSPDADGPAAFLALEGMAEDGEAGRQQEGGADPLQRAAGQQPGEAGAQRAEEGCGDEQGDPADQHQPPPVKIARRAADQQQGRERQQEGVDHPLHVGGAGGEAAADRGQGDIEHRAVDEGQARGEDAGEEDEPRPRRTGPRPRAPARLRAPIG
jgi:hypothetical protein